MAFGDIIQVADNSVGNVPGATSLTVAISAAVAGNLLICGHFTGAANSTAPSGFSEAVALTDSGNADQGAIYYKIAEGGETSVIPGSATADEHAAIVIEIEGPWAASPLDQTASNGPATRNTTSSGTTSTTTQADEIAVALMTGRSQFALFTAWTNAFVARGGIASSFKYCAVATKLLTATGAQETTADHEDSIITMGGIATFKKAAGGGGLLTLDVGGTQASSGALAHMNAKAFLATQSTSGALTRSTNKLVIGSQASSGVLSAIKTAFANMAGSQTSVGVLTAIKTAIANLTGTQANSGVVSSLVNITRSAGQDAVGTLVRLTRTQLSASQSSSGAVQQLNDQILGGTQASNGILSTIKVAVATFTGSQASSGILNNLKDAFILLSRTQESIGNIISLTSKRIASVQMMGGVLAKVVSIARVGVQTSTGILSAIKTALLDVAGSQSSGGILAAVKTALANLSSIQLSSGNLTSLLNKGITGAQSINGVLSNAVSMLRASTQTSSGGLNVIKTVLTNLAGTQSSSGVLVRLTQKTLSAFQLSSSVRRRTISQQLNGVQVSSGVLARITSKLISGVQSTFGALVSFLVGLISVPTIRARGVARERINATSIVRLKITAEGKLATDR